MSPDIQRSFEVSWIELLSLDQILYYREMALKGSFFQKCLILKRNQGSISKAKKGFNLRGEFLSFEKELNDLQMAIPDGKVQRCIQQSCEGWICSVSDKKANNVNITFL